MILLDLIQNLALLVALAAGQQVLAARWPETRLRFQVVSGLLFGAVGLVGMMGPVQLSPGLFFDGRSIILSAAGLFGSPVVACIAAGFCGAYRLWLGGPGAVMGVSVIIESAVVGMWFNYLRRRHPKLTGALWFWSFGMLVHLGMLAATFLLPGEMRWQVWRELGPAILGLYPVATMLVCLLFADYASKRRTQAALAESERRHRGTLRSIGDAVIATDADGRVTLMNPVAEMLTGWTEEAARSKSLTEIFRMLNENTRTEMENPVHRVMREGKVAGLANHTLLLGRDGTERPIADSGAPIKDEQGRITGVVLVFRDQTEEREAARKLVESESRFRALFEFAPDAIYLNDLNGTFVDGNRTAEAMIGYARTELIGKSFLTLGMLVPEDLPKAAASLSRNLQGEATGPEEFTLLKKDGGRVPVEVRSFPIQIHGQPLVLGVARDITERKQAEAALLRSERNYREIFNATNEAIFFNDAQTGRMLDVNDTMLRMYGCDSKEEVLAGTIGDWSAQEPPYTEADAQAHIRRTLEQGPQVFEWLARKKNGERFWVEVSLRSSQIGGQGRILAVARDITARKRSEDELCKLARAVEQSPVSIIITDTSGNIEFANPKFTQVTGYTLAEVLGKNPRILKSGETPAEEYRQLWETIVSGKEWRGEFHNKRKDGTLYWETASISPVRNPAGKITHFIAVKEDTTERKQLESKFLRAQRLEGIGSLASGIAHDLNNILTPVLISAPMLRADLPHEDRLQLVGTIESSAERAVGIIKQLLSMGRETEGKPVPVQLKHLLREMGKLIRETFPRSIQLSVHYPADLWPVLGNATQVHQILLNLCVNARDAMSRGGLLTLRADNVVVDEPFARMHADAVAGPYARLQVRDTGCGIPESVQDHIFDPFFTTKGPEKGTGLGLTTILGIVKNHRGFLTFASHPNQGTVFEVFLPATPEAIPAEHSRPGDPPEPRGRGETVLVVDDEAAIRQALQRTLTRFGYQVLLAEDGLEALAKYNEHAASVRVVMTDLMMPRMDGAMLCRTLRRLNPKLPLVISTGAIVGDAAPGIKENLDALGIKYILHKPHTAEVMLHMISEAINQA